MNARIFKITAFAVSLLGLYLVLTIPAMAQVRAIKGKVTNEKEEGIAGAQIVIRGTDIKREYNVKAGKKGDYSCMVQSGVYSVGVHATGYSPAFFQNIRPSLGTDTEVNFKLKEGEDYRLPMEMTKEEIAKFQAEAEVAKKQQASSAEVQAFLDAAKKLEAEGKWAEAAEEYKKGLAKDNTQPYLHANLAEALAKLGKKEEALAEYDIAVQQKPDDAAIMTNKGVLLSNMGKTAESQAAFKAAAQINPAGAGKAFFNLGATLVNAGQVDQAADAFRQAISSDPNFAEAYFQLGICLSAKAETIPDAIKMLEKYMSMGTTAKPENIEVAKQLIGTLK